MAMRQCIKKDARNVMVLNMASVWKPGGGVRTGKTAQEEVIFRRTNAFMTHPESYYPLEDWEMIYSPEVHVVRDSSYKFLPEKEQRIISMLALPAIRNPQIYIENGIYYYTNSEDYDLMSKKIESIFLIGIHEKKEVLILGALGCGAYHNPVDAVLEIFQKMIKKYKNYFRYIGFAVLGIGKQGQLNFEKFYNALHHT
jgi:uncharacterized protein (TIGR02452 family)